MDVIADRLKTRLGEPVEWQLGDGPPAKAWTTVVLEIVLTPTMLADAQMRGIYGRRSGRIPRS